MNYSEKKLEFTLQEIRKIRRGLPVDSSIIINLDNCFIDELHKIAHERSLCIYNPDTITPRYWIAVQPEDLPGGIHISQDKGISSSNSIRRVMSETIIIPKEELIQMLRQAAFDAAEMVISKIGPGEDVVNTSKAMKHLGLSRPTFRQYAKKNLWKNHGTATHPRWKISELKIK